MPLGHGPAAVTIGNFDGVHLGHQAMLRRLTETARARGLAACVLTFEPHPREFFAPQYAPARLTTLREKLERFHGLGIDWVHVCRFNREFSRLDAEAFIDRILCRGLKAEWVLIGDDFRFGAKRMGNHALLQEAGASRGFEVVAMHSVTVEGLRAASTAIRDALSCGDLELARLLLGRPYSISGRVVGGDQVGTRLGYPTANIQMKHNKPPLSGVFAVELSGLEEGSLPGAASLGVRPTVKNDGKPTLEVHLFDFERRIYGEHVRVDFLHKLRDEMKFPDFASLTRQIARDVADAKTYFTTAKKTKAAD